jgi:glycosyltransferase involved in cell wall biosynthesis
VTTSPSKHLGLVYLGTRGGGVHLTKQVLAEFSEGGFKIHLMLSKSNEEIESYSDFSSLQLVKFFEFKILKFLRFKSHKKDISAYINCLLNSACTDVLITMPHPLNLYLIRELKKQNIRVISIIHDLQKHPGEYWPTKTFIKKLIVESNACLVLSKFIYNQLSNFGEKILLADLPSERLDVEYLRLNPIVSTPYCLFIGRIKRYKGLKQLLRAWSRLDDTPFPLVIAGDGRLPLLAKRTSNVIFLHRWLKTEEIYNLIINSEFVILPYKEATQSGILKIAAASNKPCLVTPVGALADYQEFGFPTIQTKSASSNSICQGLKLAIDGDWVVEENRNKPESIYPVILNYLSY